MNGANGRVPLRTCCACRSILPKDMLFHVVRSSDGSVLFGRTGKENGRGAYVCRKDRCLENAKRKDLLGRALKTSVPKEIYDMMIKELTDLDRE